jgi:D-arabinose 1-dehydrogenase-like Zn-dependent alcohol dehydrogenase
MELGADAVFASGERLPERVDAVAETVGAATWDHSLKSLKPGGVLVISGATSGADPPAGLNRVFFLQLSVVGSTMGTRDELDRLVRLCVERDVRPVVESAVPMTEARGAFAALAAGDVFGKLVLTR